MKDLEEHLPAEWWKTVFDHVYLMTDGDVVENPANTAHEVDMAVRIAGLTHEHRVLDLCCGQGRHTLELARRGFSQVSGMDASAYLLGVARKRARAAGLDVEFLRGDARALAVEGPRLDAILVMGNSFGYFERAEEDRAVLTAARQALRPGGRLLLDLVDGAFLRENFEPRSWEWIDKNHLVCRERALARDAKRLVCREVVMHATKGVIVDRFYAERLYTTAEVATLLERCGFGGVELTEAPETGSDRNQDLGLMARRIFVTARSGERSRKAAPREVTVLLGDHRLPDPVKRGGRFNSEDHVTVDRVKAALSELKGFRFRYLDRHETLLTELQRQRPELLLNLCDEGLENDAERELHVPALMEILNVPCSGAGPSCLALCFDKQAVSAVAQGLGIPVPREVLLGNGEPARAPSFGFPCIVKPNRADGGFGITRDSVVHDLRGLTRAVARLRAQLPGGAVLVQEFLGGAELTVMLVGNPGALSPLPVLEADFSRLPEELPRLLGWESKFEPDSPYWTQVRFREATLDPKQREALLDASCRLFERLECRDYARFDFRAGADGQIRLLEVNPNPGWCWDGKMALMAELGGVSYPAMLEQILEAAFSRVTPLALRAVKPA